MANVNLTLTVTKPATACNLTASLDIVHVRTSQGLPNEVVANLVPTGICTAPESTYSTTADLPEGTQTLAVRAVAADGRTGPLSNGVNVNVPAAVPGAMSLVSVSADLP